MKFFAVLLLTTVLLAPVLSTAQGAPVTVNVTDENGVAVPGAHVRAVQRTVSSICESDHVGHCQVHISAQEPFTVEAQKPGFYRVKPVQVAGATQSVDLTLVHEKEVRESVDVVESPPVIDPEATSHTETLSAREILNVPYPTSREIRNVLPLMPQVVRDMSGNIHVGGASVTQQLTLIDGFNITDPAASGAFIHLNADSVRNIEAFNTRYSTQYGKGNAVLAFDTGMGDDRFRYTATNFVPSVQMRKGLNFDKWVPRFTFSGPIKKGRAWFLLAPDAEYDNVIVRELPNGADRGTFWQLANLAKAQVNVTPSNILTGELLATDSRSQHAGISRFTPIQATTNINGSSYLAGIRDQQYFKSGLLVEFGVAAVNYSQRSRPESVLPTAITPGGNAGSFFQGLHADQQRNQVTSTIYLPPVKWHGRHDVRLGGSLEFLKLNRDFFRRPVQVFRADTTLARTVEFIPALSASTHNTERSAYVQDRWAFAEKWLVETGVRFDEDNFLHNLATSPRIALVYAPRQDTKFSVGTGLYHSPTNLDLASRDISGTRQDTFFAPDGVTPRGAPIVTQFVVPRRSLDTPRFFNWSASIEQKLPWQVYTTLGYVEKHGKRVLTFENIDPSQQLGTFMLTNGRADRYRALELTVKRTFKNVYPVFLSYTRSSARTNALLDFSVDSIVLGNQFGGPLPWDTPNRFVGWGWMPFIKQFTLGYSLEMDDGFPFLLTNQEQQVVPLASSVRFPRFYTITLAAERRFHVIGTYLALRGTFENITNRRNPNTVDNNLNSPTFLNFGSLDHRTFNLRIRFLGRTKAQADEKQDSRAPAKP